MSGSALPDLQLAVYNALVAAASLSGVTISWGPPDDVTPREYVAVGFGDGPGEESTRNWRTLGSSNPLAVEEQVTIRLSVEALSDSGKNRRPAYERTSTLADAVEVVLGTDVSFGNVIFHSLTTTRRGEFFRTADRQGHRTFLTLSGMARRSAT